ncbi:DUF4404 family protein [Aestuariirhabdus litorea]|uniref:DUF4404 family protein n=1 Tax=Aestuariirhabdus litorea TaxID=2528527 RepID=A0A3P3VKU1_9GAMM|nr:DUF4404 family protein [Aestuariirhabdus litorea]RRJ82488.1 DUF4404 family protein [Aestuariirhabdus litorea]RWW92649.1 DUF4404 family protein [Endozoicomonadaceae bacterium GTF-13]
MPKERLYEQVNNLRKVIEDVEAADECTTAELRQIADEINHTLADPDLEAPSETLLNKLEEEAIRFGESHPAIATAARQVLELLKNIGV